MKIFNRLVPPANIALHDGPDLHEYAEQAWTEAARSVAHDISLDVASRLDLVQQMLTTDATGPIGQWRVLRFAHTNVDSPALAAGGSRYRVADEGISLVNPTGTLAGTYGAMVFALLSDLLQDADDDGVQVRAVVRVSDLPDDLREQAPDVESVWLEGVAYHVTTSAEVTFADGHSVDLSGSEFVHVTY